MSDDYKLKHNLEFILPKCRQDSKMKKKKNVGTFLEFSIL